MRSFLAVLGILVGTGSVVALITSSQLATTHALAQFKTLGTNLLAVDIEPLQDNNQTQGGGLNLKSIPVLEQASPSILKIAPYINLYQSMTFHGVQVDGPILGATGALADIAKIDIASGRFVSSLDGSSFYCVVGAKLAQTMHDQGYPNPLGQHIQIGQWIFTVIGVAKSWQPNIFMYADIDSGVIVPIQTSYLLSQYAQISNLLVRLVPNSPLMPAQNALQDKLQLLLPNQKINIRNPDQIVAIMGKQQRTFTWLLGAVGGISLIVGGIGVMNIMLVSVIERRREIGIRIAIGARRTDIRRMFLIEAVILTLFGGLIGIVLGLAISYTLAAVTGWGIHWYFMPPLLGFTVSVLVGMASGFYPAVRASKLDPIKILQSA